MEHCCCCHARLRGKQHCQRCQADLTQIIKTEQAARFWLDQAIQFKQKDQLTQSIAAIIRSLQFEKTPLAIHFYQFLIQQLYQETLGFLIKHQPLSAKRLLHKGEYLVSQTPQLQKISRFTDYLLLNEAENRSSL